jgi:hypothetical protein
MAKARLLQTACAIALLAAAPAFAQQTITQPATTGADNSVNAPVTHGSMTPNNEAAQSNMAPADQMGSSSSMGSSTHHAMGRRSSGSMHARRDTSQNSAVDQLNEQSYQAAQRGQAFSASDSGSSGNMSSGGSSGMRGSGSMNDMSGGSMSPTGSASGAGGGTGSGMK